MTPALDAAPPECAALPNAVVRQLKAAAQRLEPLVTLGKTGLSDAFLKGLDDTLAAHELVKVKFGEFKSERKSLARQMAARTGSHLVWIVGHVAVFFRPHPDPAKRRIALAEPR